MTSTITTTRDEAQIRQLITEQASGICAKNVEQIMAHYGSEAVLFDVKPPLQFKGVAAIRQMWESSLPYMPDSSGTEMQDLSITIGGDLALAHWLLRYTGVAADHPAAQMWLRVTGGYQQQQGEWQIVHEHCSIPFNPGC
ncbi:nuclear transport factor 2 family protein [Leptolyngbya sp. CCNP1308]|uniref:YybH family protein n=1 Tax=Leptolyngbya sp. CCNP1308 TaxID=3110255 RepID=UPI002B20648A|nr:nuclear transport factor 2 family protein [Leptolyngbya sp. CCNP1308]MEA5448754.1 nuclear transport factor 2 family protein [Leptolyngbya sp. CCNP1308]